MVEPTNTTDHGNGSCPYNVSASQNISPIISWQNADSRKFNWTEEQQGLLLGCFFYGYTVSVGLLGLTADIIGARYLIGFSLGISSVLSLFYELFANWGFGYLVALRTVQGVGYLFARIYSTDILLTLTQFLSIIFFLLKKKFCV